MLTAPVNAIRDHARQRPDAPAVVTPEAVVSYGELWTRIDLLARELVRRGVGPEQVCAVAVGHGVDAVVAMVAVLAAGGAFLTLDPEQPRPRLTHLVSTARARFLVATDALAQPLRPLVPGPTVVVDRIGDPPDPGVTLPEVPAGALAYVSHTSGSTGAPSAVLIERRSLDAYLRFVVRDYDLGPATVTLQVAPLGYDASIRDVLAPLTAGGRLVMVPRATLLRPAELVAAIRDFGIDSMLSVTPSFLTFLTQQQGVAAELRGVRLVVTSGESLRPFLAAGGRDKLPGRLVNQYGPTECTMTSLRYEVPRVPDTSVDRVGTPIDGMVLRLLGPDLAPVPPNSVGEVYLAGTGVARGYCGEPARTASRFIADPFGAPGSRMYRTGDLARWLPDGNLEFLGRSDRQIKIRGYRVDPAEIEGRLLSHPAVTGAVVTAAVDERGRTYLVAHVTGALAQTPDPALRAHLAEALPYYMLPRRFVRMERLPMGRSNKVDRAALVADGPSPAEVGR
jgi:D-alanine--poly(phosphoribitol) ligase subunit 1